MGGYYSAVTGISYCFQSQVATVIFRKFFLYLLLPALIFLFSQTATAQEGTSLARVDDDINQRQERIRSILEEKGVTNDWFGAGRWLSQQGIELEAALAGFSQDQWWVESESSLDGGGKLSALLRLDLHKMGVWQGLRLTVHSEYNFGETTNGFGGTVLPVNTAMNLPGTQSGDRYDTSSLFLTQRFNDTFTLIVGKTNLADVAALHPYAGGTGITGYMNAGLATAPNGTVPPYVYGGLLLIKTEPSVFNFAIYGGNTARGKLDFTEVFEEGYLLSGGFTIPVTLRGLAGMHSVSVIWGDRDASTYYDGGDLLSPSGIENIDMIDTRRLIFRYSFYQQVADWGSKPDHGWGVWSRASLGENDLTAVRWSVAGGVGGNSPLPTRERDRWGLGLFYFSFADFLKDPGIVPVSLGDERSNLGYD
jgi:porin